MNCAKPPKKLTKKDRKQYIDFYKYAIDHHEYIINNWGRLSILDNHDVELIDSQQLQYSYMQTICRRLQRELAIYKKYLKELTNDRRRKITKIRSI